VEIAKNQIQLAREKCTDNTITYIEGDITKLDTLPLKSNSYDIILLEHVILEIESTNKLKKIFDGAYKLLKT
jgi:ubiquinone/menaquinone biosynthesis C-methylase UbiE